MLKRSIQCTVHLHDCVLYFSITKRVWHRREFPRSTWKQRSLLTTSSSLLPFFQTGLKFTRPVRLHQCSHRAQEVSLWAGGRQGGGVVVGSRGGSVWGSSEDWTWWCWTWAAKSESHGWWSDTLMGEKEHMRTVFFGLPKRIQEKSNHQRQRRPIKSTDTGKNE